MNYNTSTTQTVSVRTITIIHYALLAGQLLFALVTFVVGKEPTTKISTADPFLIAVPIITISSLFASNLLYKKFMAEIPQGDLQSKLTRFQTAAIIRYALIEGASLFAIVVFFITRDYIYFTLAVGLIVYFFTLRPTKYKIAEELQLTYEEKLDL